MAGEERIEYPMTPRIVTAGVGGGLIAVLAAFGVMTVPVVPGVAGIYPAIAFIVAFGAWFGIWGAIAAYIGCFIGAGIVGGVPLAINVYWSLADFWEALIPAIGFKLFKADPELKNKKDWAIFWVFGVFLGNLIGAAWGSTTLAIAPPGVKPVIPWSAVFWPTFVFWFVGNILVTAIVSPLLLIGLSKYIKRTSVYCEGLIK